MPTGLRPLDHAAPMPRLGEVGRLRGSEAVSAPPEQAGARRSQSVVSGVVVSLKGAPSEPATYGPDGWLRVTGGGAARTPSTPPPSLERALREAASEATPLHLESQASLRFRSERALGLLGVPVADRPLHRAAELAASAGLGAPAVPSVQSAVRAASGASLSDEASFAGRRQQESADQRRRTG